VVGLLWLTLAAGAALTVVVVVLPRRASRARWRRLLHAASSRSVAGRLRLAVVRTLLPAAGRPAVARWSAARPAVAYRAVAFGAVGAGALGFVLAGPVAAAVLAAYGATGAALALRAATHRAETRSLRAAVDAVAALAAELRAGLTVGSAMAAASRSLAGPVVVGDGAATAARRVEAAVEVAEASGAPLADVLDRLDTHLRAVDRARATASAQAAGARASALLLAAMPVAGTGLGFLIGVDSLHVLLHTPLGSACVVGSVVLQLSGLAWAARLSRVEVPA